MSTAKITIDMDSRLVVNPNLVLRIEDDECALLFDPDSGRVQMLNETAVAIWQQLDGVRSLAEVVNFLHGEFDEIPVDIDQQVLCVAVELAEIGAIGLPEAST